MEPKIVIHLQTQLVKPFMKMWAKTIVLVAHIPTVNLNLYVIKPVCVLVFGFVFTTAAAPLLLVVLSPAHHVQ